MRPHATAPQRRCAAHTTADAGAGRRLASTGLSAPAFAKSVKPTVVAAPDFGPNVHILTPDMALADIQTVVDGIAARQVSNQFVEHDQKYQAIWNGERGKVIFFQNEMPYDPPSQAAWSKSPTSPDWAALKVDKDVKAFNAWALGSYSFFNQGIDIFAARAFEVPHSLPKGSLKDLTTVFLDPSHGMDGTLNVINSTGGPAVITNPSTPVTVTSFP